MAVLPIVEVPDPILTERAREVIVDMADTMYAAPGVGLAAPQVGVGLRVIVADLDTETEEVPVSDEEVEDQRQLYALVNPEIIEEEDACTFEEGCLSVPDFTVEIQRINRIVVQALDPDGEPIELEAMGFPAVVLQHELDHLDGKTLVDRMSPLKRRLYLKGQRKKKAANGE